MTTYKNNKYIPVSWMERLADKLSVVVTVASIAEKYEDTAIVVYQM